MPQSLSAVYIHLIFSTKDRRPFLRDHELRAVLHSYMGEVSKRLDCPPLRIGGVEDHVHLLARFGRTITQGEWVKELKRVSHQWLEHQRADFSAFGWQGVMQIFRSANPTSSKSKHISPTKKSIIGK